MALCADLRLRSHCPCEPRVPRLHSGGGVAAGFQGCGPPGPSEQAHCPGRTWAFGLTLASCTWWHGPQDEGGAQAWAVTRDNPPWGHEDPEAAAPTLLRRSPKPRGAAITPRRHCCHQLPVTQWPDRATDTTMGDNPSPPPQTAASILLYPHHQGLS